MSGQGFSVDPYFLRRESAVMRERHTEIDDVSKRLRRAFDRDRATLGQDAYGAELSKHLPQMEETIFSAIASYLDGIKATGDGLAANAITYESAVWPSE
ncbi:hypothetical protein [Nonomuraea cavernae]|uniref:Uncharacterized protein n=1 Tax=Nonomuraea cavernae TaxID=2045107 RepID=A0A917YY35_9ACTN|nr:hypothetical protein [Nonomuraea cavernae]MCA2187456.1 hypothetical protein [Nonomuraea cavernae]GGO68679.1 hypothetical protein GCM10012289_28010 [Nonomuraea cavernae]